MKASWIFLWLCLGLAASVFAKPEVETLSEAATTEAGGSGGPAVTDAPKPEAVSTKPKPGRKRTTKDWSKVKLDDIEKSWQQGDAEEELEHEYEHSQRIAKKKAGSGGLGPNIDINNPASVRAAMKKNPMAFSGLGQQTASSMVFVELTDKQPEGAAWDKESVDKLCGKWSALLKTAHLHANTFNLGDAEKKDSSRQVLVSIDKGWQAADIFKFIMMQPETVKITKDSKGAFAATSYNYTQKPHQLPPQRRPPYPFPLLSSLLSHNPQTTSPPSTGKR